MKLSFVEFDATIREVESENNPEAWGDDGRAMGSRQEHPAFVAQWFPSIHWRLAMKWDDVTRGALLAFYNRAVADGVDDVDAAVGFHLHGQPHGNAGDSPDYAQRFREAAARLGYAL